MEPSISLCPICGEGRGEGLLDHLNSHSKEDLITILLQKQHVVSSPSSSSVPKGVSNAGESVNINTRSARDRSTNSTHHHHKGKTKGEGHQNRKRSAVVDPLRITPEESVGGVEYELEFIGDQLVSSDSTIAVSFSERHEDSEHSAEIQVSLDGTGHRNSEESTNHHHHDVFLLQSFADNSETSGGADDSRTHENVQESDNATSQTSIIKYIIDQNSNGNEDRPGQPERWTLPDGRTIPVYSSFTQVHISNANARPIMGNPGVYDHLPGSNFSERHGPAVPPQLDLMTDEEIPPRGEISEYEESNTSSFISEDSSIRLVSLTDSRRVSPVVAIELESVSAKPSKRRKKGENDRNKKVSHQFICAECPKVQKFKSLFEMCQHKLRIHPTKKNCSASSSASNQQSSSCNSRIIEDEKISIEMEYKPDPLRDDEKSRLTKKEFFCIYCKYITSSKNHLGLHMETIHCDKPAKPSIFECTTCGKVFPARTNLRKHLLIHRERKHICSTCSKGFTSNFKLMEHMRVHTKIYPYKCETCGKSYRTPSLLNHHVKNTHVPECDRPVKPRIEYFCGICHKVLRSKRSYKSHTQVHHAKPKKCPYCCENYIRPSVLVRHIRIAHDPQFESNESKDCPVCFKKLHPNSMIKHMRIHADLKPYPCNVCGKHFRTYANLTSHSWSHTNIDKPYKCRLCSKSYLFRKNLEYHMMVHKRRTMHFVCNECGMKFTHKVNMRRHLEEHYSEKKYKCKTCGKAFQRNYYLLEHERIHTGIKPFICNICGKASTTKSNHRAHVKIHDARESGSQEG